MVSFFVVLAILAILVVFVVFVGGPSNGLARGHHVDGLRPPGQLGADPSADGRRRRCALAGLSLGSLGEPFEETGYRRGDFLCMAGVGRVPPGLEDQLLEVPCNANPHEVELVQRAVLVVATLNC